LFCGAGGLTHGLSKAGVEVWAGVDIDPACRFPYTANNKAKFLLQSVGDLSGDDLSRHYTEGSVRLLAGCAPCQTFSSYNQNASKEDDRWWLLRHFARLVGQAKPELVAMENVPRLMNHTVSASLPPPTASGGPTSCTPAV
jgi:DNA (cytosine-5)-methyltransferase 1